MVLSGIAGKCNQLNRPHKVRAHNYGHCINVTGDLSLHLRIDPENPNSFFNRIIKIVWSTVSNADVKSNKIQTLYYPESAAINFRKTVSV